MNNNRMKKMKNQKGFTLVELMVAIPLVLMVFVTVFGTYITMQKLFPGGMAQVALQSYGRSCLGRISNTIRTATDASVNSGGDTLTITLDPSRTYNDPSDDISAQYIVSGTDIIYDPDTSVSNDDMVILENVQAETGVPYFQESQDLIVVTFKATKTDVLLGTQNCSLSTTIKVRSSDG